VIKAMAAAARRESDPVPRPSRFWEAATRAGPDVVICRSIGNMPAIEILETGHGQGEHIQSEIRGR
jgi:hypothetical protein